MFAQVKMMSQFNLCQQSADSVFGENVTIVKIIYVIAIERPLSVDGGLSILGKMSVHD